MPTSSLDKLQYEDLPLKVYRVLKHMILTGEIKSGQKLQQEQLAEQLGVSRTPLLTAFSKLERERLLEIRPRKGTFVRHFSHKELIDIYDIRLRLEPLGAYEAALSVPSDGVSSQNNPYTKHLRETVDAFISAVKKGDEGALKEADYDIHMEIMKMSGNDFLYQIISTFNIIVIANIEGFPKDGRVSIKEHETLYKAIAQHQPEKAQETMYNHIVSSKEIIEKSNIGIQ